MPLVFQSGDIRRLKQCLNLNTAFTFGENNFTNNGFITDLASETAARIAADNSEAAARIAADTVLQNQITALSNETLARGVVNIGNGVEGGTVSGLGLASVPSQVLLTIQKPVGGLQLWACVAGAPTTDGFVWTLNGVTDSANYKLYYQLLQ